MALQNDRLFALHDEGKSMTEIAEIVGMDRRQVKTILESLTKTHDYHPYGLTDESKWPEIKARIIEMHRENKEVLTYKIIKEIKEKFNEKVTIHYTVLSIITVTYSTHTLKNTVTILGGTVLCCSSERRGRCESEAEKVWPVCKRAEQREASELGIGKKGRG